VERIATRPGAGLLLSDLEPDDVAEAAEAAATTVAKSRPDPDTDELEALNDGYDAAEPDAAKAPGATPGGVGARFPAKRVLVASALVVGAVIALVIVLIGGLSDGGESVSQERPSSGAEGDSQQRRARAKPERPRILPIALAGAKATDFDPNGGNGERPEDVANVIDGDARTAWQTELYPTGTFGKGVGIYIALPRPQALRAVRVRTSTPGWDAEIYGASKGPPADLTTRGWTKLGSRPKLRGLERIPLKTGAKPTRYCLIWITKLPPDKDVVAIAEIDLLAAR